jgi:hypothetical protein
VIVSGGIVAPNTPLAPLELAQKGRGWGRWGE